MIIEDRIKNAFSSELGQQCNELFSTADGKIFIRQSDAIDWIVKNKLSTEYYQWVEEYSGNDPNSKVRNYLVPWNFDSFKSVLQFAKLNREDYGQNKAYHFVICDGRLFFLKRNDEISEHVRDCMTYGEQRGDWPANYYDGEELFNEYIGQNDSIIITLLNELNFKVHA